MTSFFITPLDFIMLMILTGFSLFIFIGVRYLYRGAFLERRRKPLILIGILIAIISFNTHSRLSDHRPFKVEYYYRWHGVDGGPILAQAALDKMHPPGSSLEAFRHTMDVSGMKLGSLNKTPREAMGDNQSRACCVTTYYKNFPILMSLGLEDASAAIYVEYNEKKIILKTTVHYRGVEWI